MRVVLPAGDPSWPRRILRRNGEPCSNASARWPPIRSEQGRLQYVLLDTDPGQITPIAEAVFRLVGVKPEFLPEIVPPPYYGCEELLEKASLEPYASKHRRRRCKWPRRRGGKQCLPRQNCYPASGLVAFQSECDAGCSFHDWGGKKP